MAASRGFTLIELLVVMLIVGVLTTTVTLSLSPDSRQQGLDAAARFARVLEQGVDVAQQGTPMALAWQANGYRFAEYGADARWRSPSDTFFAEGRWPDGVRAESARFDGVSWPAGELRLIWQDGEANPLEITLTDGRVRWQVVLNPLGFARVEEAGVEAGP
ncbi:prepilin-type N-terminal cleavage/methylation domain-containing protein [Crenobacter caeni]|uniref:Prepilin-type N-terminal cleavage/methylation domain-containing protein n=1 Tax=Crenobacter caeni TaxID=2705474 RepID=A0A6B2KSY4_9NEIS|nr:prepilin-type N-terminal cleavage/methylation domain-containing protein [Crenobacter caeni]NDV13352.1 prepilin-type N-terminal cleavage/methylation domain-containing protein [Crenobacter caeni]